MSEKQKKQLITLSLVGAVLLAGIVAGFLVVQNQQFVQNRAQTPAPVCTAANGRCILPVASGSEFSPYIIQVKEVGTDGSQKIIATSPQNATSLNFSAAPFKRYICEVVSTADSTCKNSAEKAGPVCVNLQLSPAVTPVVTVRVSVTVTPIVTPVTAKVTTTSTPTVTPKVGATVTLIATPTAKTATPTSKTATATPTKSTTNSPTPTTNNSTGGTGITPSSTPTSAPAAATATKAAAGTATQAASQSSSSSTATSAPTSASSSTSLPVSGTVHPAIILGIISLFIIVLGLVF